MTHHIFAAARHRFAWALPVIVSLFFALPASAQTKGGTPEHRAMKNPVPSTPASIAAGAARYTKYCGFCHADDGKGDGPMAPKDSHPPDLTDATWVYGSTDGEIYMVISAGLGPKSDMKPFAKKITETDIWNLVNYLKTLRKPAAH